MKENWKLSFFTIWAGQAISVLSSSVLQMALIWHLTTSTQSAMVLSLASIAGFMPTAILGIFAGTFVDRWNRKLTIIGADLFIAAVSLTLVVYAMSATLPAWLVMVVLFIRSIGGAFHTPAISAITPLIVPEDKLTQCAGYTQSLQTVGFIVGTAIAAALYPIWSMSSIVMLDVLGAVIASLTVVLIKIPAPPRAVQHTTPNFFFELKEGITVIHQNKGLYALLWISAAFMFVYSPINALFPLLSMNYFSGTTTQASIAEIAFAIGMVLGGVALSLYHGFQNRGLMISSAIMLMGAALVLSGILPTNGFIVFAILCVMMGLSVPLYTVPQMSLMQERISPEYLGRVFGLYGSIMSFAMPFGLILSALFADIIGINHYFLFCGIACMILAVITISIPSIRHIEKEYSV